MDFYKELISYNSATENGKNGIFDYVSGLLKSFNPAYMDTLRGRYIWATFGSNEKTGGLLFSGHLDVVPHENEDAFSLKLKDNLYYGRGTCDMKGYCAVALATACKLKNKKLKTPVHFCFTLDEETCMEGIKSASFLLKKYKPDWCIIGEPTMMEVVVSNMGSVEGTVRVKGIPAHSSEPEKGINAINILIDIMNFINTLPGIVNIGVISGGTANNILAEYASCEYQIRVTKDEDKIIKMIDDFIAKQLRGEITHTYYVYPPFVDKDGLSRKKMLSFLNKTEKDVMHVKYLTEAGIIQKCGVNPVICGPGSILRAHKTDEYCEADQLHHCTEILNMITDEIILQGE